ncbi:MAG: NAD(P)H-dependent oxidoreductase, partial [Candidatus Omnitrophota bacterium]
MKKILFLCGSPRAHASTSYRFAKYTANFLQHKYEFIDITHSKLSLNPNQAEPQFLEIVDKMKKADMFVWVFGIMVFSLPVQMQCFFDKLFTQGNTFPGKLATSIITSRRIRDDFAVDRIRFLSEQLGISYLEGVSVDGENIFPFTEEQISEASCRRLARKISKILSKTRFPVKQTQFLARKFLSSEYFGTPLNISQELLSPKIQKKQGKIVIITGHSLEHNPNAKAIAALCDKFSEYLIEVIELEKNKIKPCRECNTCMVDLSCQCRLKDDLGFIRGKMQQAQGIVLLANSACGLVDAYMKTFFERLVILSHLPNLQNKYGFVILTGADYLEKEPLDYFDYVLQSWGVKSIGKLLQTDDNLEY